MEKVTPLKVASMKQVGPYKWECEIKDEQNKVVASTEVEDRMAAWLWCEQQMEQL